MASVAKRKDSGKWEVRYLEAASGRHRSKSFTMKKDADAYRRKVEIEIENGDHIAPRAALTVEEVCKHFGEQLESRLAIGQVGRGHYDFTCSVMRTQIVPRLGKVKMVDLTAVTVEAWVTELRTSGNRATGKGLANSTVRSILAIFKRVEDFAMKHQYLRHRVVLDAKREVGSLQSEPIRTFTVAEMRQLMTALDGRRKGLRPRDRSFLRCYVYLAAFCGLRVGEISGLTDRSLDMRSGTIKVRNNLTSYGDLKGPKTKAGVRDIPMPAQVREVLQDWPDHHRWHDDRGLVFATSTGAFVHRHDLDKPWRRLLIEAGLGAGRSFHFHALRHFAASHMISAGVPLPDVAKLLGHRTFDMTLQVYAHPVQDVSEHRGTLERLAALTIPPQPMGLMA